MMKKKISVTKLALLLIFLFVSLCCWALSSPIGSSPDDDYHLPSIWCAETALNPECQETPNGMEVPRQLLASGCFKFQPNVSGSCTENFENEFFIHKHLNNIEKLYQNGFYSVLSIFKTESKNIFVLKVRLFNSLLFIFGLVLLLYMSKDLDIWIKSLFAQIVCFIPLGFFIIPSTNPSSWSLIFLPALWISIYLVGEKQDSKITKYEFSVIIFFWVCVNFARSDGALYTVIALISILIIFFRKKGISSRYYILNFILIAFSAVIYLLNPTAKSVASGQANPIQDSTSVFDKDLFFHNVQGIFYYLTGAAGKTGLGWLDTYVPSFVWKSMVFAIATLLAIAFLLLATQRNHKGLASLTFLMLSYLSIPIFVLQVNNFTVGRWVQPRYMLPLLIIAILIAVCEIRVSQKNILLGVIILSPLLLANFSLSLGANIQRYSGLIQDPFNLMSYSDASWSMLGYSALGIFVLGMASFFLFLFSAIDFYSDTLVKEEGNLDTNN